MSTYHGCPYDQVDELWDSILPLVIAGKDEDFAPEDIYDALRAGLAQLWYAMSDDRSEIEAILVTSIHTYPARRVCQVWICTGAIPADWISFLTYLEKWAVEQGCSALALQGRPGWERRLKKLGWGVRSVWIERNLHTSTTVQ